LISPRPLLCNNITLLFGPHKLDAPTGILVDKQNARVHGHFADGAAVAGRINAFVRDGNGRLFDRRHYSSSRQGRVFRVARTARAGAGRRMFVVVSSCRFRVIAAAARLVVLFGSSGTGRQLLARGG